MSYNNKLNPDQQITAEERIAAYLFDTYGINEECSAEAGRGILRLVLKEFRPDLLVVESTVPKKCPSCNGETEWADIKAKRVTCLFCGYEGPEA